MMSFILFLLVLSNYQEKMTVDAQTLLLAYLHLEGVGQATQVAARFVVQTTGESVVVYTGPLVNDVNPVPYRLLYQALGAQRV